MEILQSLKKPSIWMTLAIEDLRDRFKRTLIGMIWIPVTFLLFVGVKILIFSQLNGASLQEFTVFVVIGYWVWQNINSNIVDGCYVFIRSAGYIKSSPLPYTVYILQSVFRNNITSTYNLGVILVLFLIVGIKPSVEFLYILPAYLIYTLNATWVGMFLGVMSARFRDITHLVQSLLRVVFFMTPIIWLPEELGRLGKLIAFYNPFTHFIEIIRHPLMHQTFPQDSWLIVLCITVIGSVGANILYDKYRNSIIHWL